MFESSKSVFRRCHDIRFTTRYFVGDGIDIGAGPDSIGYYSYMFPGIKSCKAWDLPDGDAQYLESVPDNTYDFVHSSHCLEHLTDPKESLANWIRVLKPGGYLIVMIPDEDLYEQGVFPSTFNTDHKWTFSIHKETSWSPNCISVLSMISAFADSVTPLKIERIDHLYDFSLGRCDQTISPVTEAAIEFICQKKK